MDPEEEVNVHVRAFGLFGVHIEQVDTSISMVQARKFLHKVVGTRSDYTRHELVQFMRAKILEYVPDLLAKSIVDQGIGILKISTHLVEFSENICNKLIEYFDDFGLTLDNFSFHNINVPDEDLRVINEMKIQRKSNQLEAEGAARKMDIESAARTRMREREGYTYQQEQSFAVMEAAASNEGTSSAFMGAGMGLGMGFGVGGAVGTGMGNLAQGTLGKIDMMQTNKKESVACHSCGSSSPIGAKFCLNCGSKLEEESRCPYCNEIIVNGAKFCLSCGKRLSNVCPNCNTELAKGAKFCVECGTKI